VLRRRPLVSAVAPSDLMVVVVNCTGNNGNGDGGVGMIGGARTFYGTGSTGTDGFDVVTDASTG
jgi:hypothetical protein